MAPPSGPRTGSTAILRWRYRRGPVLPITPPKLANHWRSGEDCPVFGVPAIPCPLPVIESPALITPPPLAPFRPTLRALASSVALSLILAIGLAVDVQHAWAHQEAEGDEGLTELRPLRVVLLTMDQGEAVWEKFGHNAIMVRDEATGEEVAWNWGLFNFGDVDFIPRFLRGTMEYSMGGMEAQWMIQQYAADNRSVYANEVFLTLEQAAELDRFVRWNAQPENRDYIYDYFRDNCSTRVRDVLDGVLGGALRAHFADRLTPRSYRWHARRLVQETLWIDQGLSFLLGTRGDRPISEWEAMYVPMVLMELLEDFEFREADGGTRPLLGPRQVLFEAERDAAPATPPALSPLFPMLGIVGAGLFVLLGGWAAGGGLSGRAPARTAPPQAVASGRAASRAASSERAPQQRAPSEPAPRRAAGPRRWGRIGLGLLGAGWTLLAGVLGLILVLVWFTDHVFIHRNVNILYASPLALALAVLLVGAVTSTDRARGRTGRWAAILALVIAAGSLVAMVLQAAGVIVQGNAEVVALALPLNLGLAIGLIRLHRGEIGGTSPHP